MEKDYISEELARKLYQHRLQIPEIPITEETKWIDGYIPVHTFEHLKNVFHKDPILSIYVETSDNAEWETQYMDHPAKYIYEGKKYSTFEYSFKEAYEGIVSEMLDDLGWFIYPDYEEEQE